ncbi:MAG TPA: serine/threonine-protein kinase [Gemmataceae bacterium]|nr:serine/threonine-protein kinase [Gemmataceae bacterium]
MAVADMNETMQTIGNYDLLQKIAEGGMGTVYRGRNRFTNEIVAVKVVPPHLLNNPVVLKRFEQEYNVARSINHPNIVKALDFGREGDLRYLVMEFVEGESLGQKIERDGRMQEQDAIRVITQVAEGLAAAHALGIIHRDVKPDNVLITADGVAKLTDLGLVKELEADLNLTRTGRGLGTPHFMAPEQFRNAKKADVRCDIYSLGATLYMMVTGELPFKSNGPLDAWMKKINNEIEPPRMRTPSISERLDWAIRRAISPDPTQRPECCREFIEDLSGHNTNEVVSTEPGVGTLPSCWYIVYTDEEGETHTVKGTTKGIRRSLRDGLLGDAENIKVSRAKEGPFDPLKQFAEFRDVILQPAEKLSDTLFKRPGASPGSKPATSKPTPTSKPTASGRPTTDPSIVGATTMPMSAVQASLPIPGQNSAGPIIDLNPGDAGISPESWRWLGIGVFFLGLCIGFSYFYMPIWRHLRYWLGLMD